MHRNCNKINKQTYRLLQKDESSHWFCIICTKDFLPFSGFIHTIKGKKVEFTHVTKKKLTAEASFFQQINSNLDANQDKYYLPSDFKQIKMDVKNNLNFFHLNISSLSYHFPELHTLLAASEIEILKSKMLESIFIEIILIQKTLLWDAYITILVWN